ncbi:formylglycine-generating enzyme family protein [Tautonia sociabilis]|uniref:formylglycine-generating enzyme family protein n=1 Tax=Tautonia sociabilis TaxID=2080755 RepID=UPI0013158D92|nr:SUMF1/EgtB/PvdO family nonheme iron enzyme [Tautonia sociabilis]
MPGPGTSLADRRRVERLEALGFQVASGSEPTADGWPSAVYQTTDEGSSIDFELSDGYYLPIGVRVDPDAGPAEDGWPRVLFREVDHGDGDSQRVEFVRIPGGSCAMGDFTPSGGRLRDNAALPVHRVTVSGFYMQRFEVTIGEIAAYYRGLRVAEAEWPHHPFRDYVRRVQDAFGLHQARRHPASCLDHIEATRLAAGLGGRLPTEAQWEYAARSRGKNHVFVGDDRERALILVEGAGSLPVATVPVEEGAEDQTEQRVADLSGNVSEWCRDYYEAYPETPSPDPDPWVRPAGRAGLHVVRGGSLFDGEANARTFDRSDPFDRINLAEYVGFRIVIKPPAIGPALGAD